jgi:hypothetical protein
MRSWGRCYKTFCGRSLYDIFDLLLDPNIVMRKTDALLQLWHRYRYRHNLSCLSLGISFSCLCKSVDLCIDATSLFLICSASHTNSLSVSPVASSLSPPLHFAYKPLANLFMLSLIAIKSSDKHRCFTQRAEHNKFTNIHNKLECLSSASLSTLAYYLQVRLKGAPLCRPYPHTLD